MRLLIIRTPSGNCLLTILLQRGQFLNLGGNLCSRPCKNRILLKSRVPHRAQSRTFLRCSLSHWKQLLPELLGRVCPNACNKGALLRPLLINLNPRYHPGMLRITCPSTSWRRRSFQGAMLPVLIDDVHDSTLSDDEGLLPDQSPFIGLFRPQIFCSVCIGTRL